jgi:hypothetical protein
MTFKVQADALGAEGNAVPQQLLATRALSGFCVPERLQDLRALQRLYRWHMHLWRVAVATAKGSSERAAKSGVRTGSPGKVSADAFAAYMMGDSGGEEGSHDWGVSEWLRHTSGDNKVLAAIKDGLGWLLGL